VNKEEWKAFAEDLDSIPFYVNRWGSCQYSGALWFYDTFMAMREDLSLEDTLEVLSVEVDLLPKQKVDILKSDLLHDLELEEDDWEGLDEDYITGLIEQLRDATRVEEVFDVLRGWSWDLWSAAEYVGDKLVGNITAPDAPGVGPVLNIVVQSENFRTGLRCAMLKELGYVEDDECFKDFDT